MNEKMGYGRNSDGTYWIEYDTPKKMTVYESLQTMSKADFIGFCSMLYYKGMNDQRHLVDDAAWIRCRLADWPADKLDEIE